MKDNVNLFYEIIDENEINSGDLANLFLNFHGTQLITDEFIDFIEEEGYYISK